MHILITGSAGRVGRAIYIYLMREHLVTGLDTTPCSTTDIIGDIRDEQLVAKALQGVDVVVHTAALHAPHVGLVSEQAFIDINLTATLNLVKLAKQAGVKQFIFTSTTALYGHASTPSNCAGWINETVTPQPKTIYHRTKIDAEHALLAFSRQTAMPVTVLQMSRCFPERADLMAVYRLTRGIDVRDVASAHACAIQAQLTGFNRFIISGKTPFSQEHCTDLYHQADKLLQQYAPNLCHAFAARNWPLPTRLDRVYDSSRAQQQLNWQPKHGFDAVLKMLDENIPEVLPVIR
ncbi:NAD-dependent epimerase/dehydratase family protein [Pseudoalteromonas fenneropenaei]|uniref:NAD-dependent epimerase/dehydratase family protein n=1 Tax=Pseudoalteromonas fenneropenaei TaxID=1737459 RepID=A0ABV7CIX8_9GAMM